MLRPYRLLAGVPHAPVLMVTNMLARLHLPAINLVLTFLVADWTGSYAVGGMIAAALTIGRAVAGPLRGRTADRVAPSKVLLVTGCGYGAGLLLVALLARPGGWVPAPWWPLVLPVGFLTGLASPPLNQVGRAMWSRVAEGPARQAAFAVEATAGELVYVVAPMLAALVVAGQGSFTAILWCAAFSVLGPTLFGVVLERAGIRETPHVGARSAAKGLLGAPGFALLLGFACLMGAGLVSVELTLIGWGRERGEPELAGVLTALWGLGSLVGGLLLGGAPGRPRLWLRTILATAGLAALVPVLPPVADPGSPWLVGAVLLIGGSAIAPMLAAANSRLGELAPQRRRSEAFGWFTSAVTGGMTLATPVAGTLLDQSGPAAAAAAAAVSALCAVCLVAHPGLRGSRPEPRAEDTAVT